MGDRSSVRRSDLYGQYESGNSVKNALGTESLMWKTERNNNLSYGLANDVQVASTTSNSSPTLFISPESLKLEKIGLQQPRRFRLETLPPLSLGEFVENVIDKECLLSINREHEFTGQSNAVMEIRKVAKNKSMLQRINDESSSDVDGGGRYAIKYDQNGQEIKRTIGLKGIGVMGQLPLHQPVSTSIFPRNGVRLDPLLDVSSKDKLFSKSSKNARGDDPVSRLMRGGGPEQSRQRTNILNPIALNNNARSKHNS